MTRLVQALWHTPRQVRARRVVFQVHLWLGLALGVYTVIGGVTGAALVLAPDELKVLTTPTARQLSPIGQPARLGDVLAAVRARHPGETVMGLDNLDNLDSLDRPRLAAVAYLAAPHADRVAGEQRMVAFDPQTGAIVAERLRYAGLLGACANLHIYLLSGSTGYAVNGGCAAAFLLLCLTGWLLWWPGVQGVRRGARVHWRARWKRLNFDLHAVGGLWANPLLLPVLATGVLFVFPKPVLDGLAVLSGNATATVTDWLAEPQTPAAGIGSSIGPDRALALAQARLDSGYRVRYLALPQAGSAMYQAIAYPAGGAEYALPVHVYVSAHDGALLAIKDARRLPAPLRWATYAYAVHFGSFLGWWSRGLWVLLGLAPAALWATGLLLWWNRSLRPRLLAVRRGAPA